MALFLTRPSVRTSFSIAFLAFFSLITLSEAAFASLKYLAPQLTMKKYDEMVSLTDKELKEKYEFDDEEEQQKARFKEAMKIILAKPDTNDGVRRMIVTDLRNQMDDFEEGIFNEITTEAIDGIKTSEKESNQKVGFTYVVVLENLLAELKPDAIRYKSLFEKIKNAKIEYSNSLKSYVALNSKNRGDAVTPSRMAEEFLKDAEAKEKSSVKPKH